MQRPAGVDVNANLTAVGHLVEPPAGHGAVDEQVRQVAAHRLPPVRAWSSWVCRCSARASALWARSVAAAAVLSCRMASARASWGLFGGAALGVQLLDLAADLGEGGPLGAQLGVEVTAGALGAGRVDAGGVTFGGDRRGGGLGAFGAGAEG